MDYIYTTCGAKSVDFASQSSEPIVLFRPTLFAQNINIIVILLILCYKYTENNFTLGIKSSTILVLNLNVGLDQLV